MSWLFAPNRGAQLGFQNRGAVPSKGRRIAEEIQAYALRVIHAVVVSARGQRAHGTQVRPRCIIDRMTPCPLDVARYGANVPIREGDGTQGLVIGFAFLWRDIAERMNANHARKDPEQFDVTLPHE